MSKKLKNGLWLVMFLLIGLSVKAQSVYKVVSPDKQTVFEASKRSQGSLKYRILQQGAVVIEWSNLGIEIAGADQSKGKLTISKQTQIKQAFLWPFGERDSVENHYSEALIKNGSAYQLLVRVYNGSVAFRYGQISKATKPLAIQKEHTSFQVADDWLLYQYNQESVFTPAAIDTLKKTCDFPATLTNQRWYVSIGEAANDLYTKAELRKGSAANNLEVAYVRDTATTVNNEWLTPWRTISVTTTAIGLHQFSDLNLRLNPPPVLPIAATVKPGKLIRAQLNTQSGLDCIDFAVKHNFQYIMFDAGWYGAEFRSSSDPTQVIPAIDMPKVISYGKQKGIGVILYVNYVGLKAKLDTLLPLYKQWGVAGMKFGFVDGLSQKGLQWLSNAIRKVNEYGFVLNIHDNYKPTGLSRTYPALLTQEGIRGDENSPDAFHTTVLPFTRYLAGPADFTYCFPNPKNSFSKNIKVSKAQQLALTVVYYSPLQAIFWYGQPNDYTNEDEIEFFKYVPTVWNESKYLAGDIGRGITVARRQGKNWFVGSASGLQDWQANINVDFLDEGVLYEATVYEDEGNKIVKRLLQLKKGDILNVQLKAAAGQAIIIRPVAN